MNQQGNPEDTQPLTFDHGQWVVPHAASWPPQPRQRLLFRHPLDRNHLGLLPLMDSMSIGRRGGPISNDRSTYPFVHEHHHPNQFQVPGHASFAHFTEHGMGGYAASQDYSDNATRYRTQWVPLELDVVRFTTTVDGRHVGELQHSAYPDPQGAFSWSNCKETYVFLSNRGPDSKEVLARPIHFFLQEKLGLRVFLDDPSIPFSADKHEELLKAAHECTHAVVLLTPRFRESEYCVQELNTLLGRHLQGNCKLLVVLWGIDDVDGYAPAINDLRYFRNTTSSTDPAVFLVEALLPHLHQELPHQQRSQIFTDSDFHDVMIDFVRLESPRGRLIPGEIWRYLYTKKRLVSCRNPRISTRKTLWVAAVLVLTTTRIVALYCTEMRMFVDRHF